ncbi:hypothetical protein M758_UG203900 [Ceratodon purpureus]|nr:hypothetical protein M758_UG203900 [Ceratodon purpureus]
MYSHRLSPSIESPANERCVFRMQTPSNRLVDIPQPRIPELAQNFDPSNNSFQPQGCRSEANSSHFDQTLLNLPTSQSVLLPTKSSVDQDLLEPAATSTSSRLLPQHAPLPTTPTLLLLTHTTFSTHFLALPCSVPRPFPTHSLLTYYLT